MYLSLVAEWIHFTLFWEIILPTIELKELGTCNLSCTLTYHYQMQENLTINRYSAV